MVERTILNSTPEDFERPDQRDALAQAAKLSEPEFVHRFGYVAGFG